MNIQFHNKKYKLLCEKYGGQKIGVFLQSGSGLESNDKYYLKNLQKTTTNDHLKMIADYHDIISYQQHRNQNGGGFIEDAQKKARKIADEAKQMKKNIETKLEQGKKMAEEIQNDPRFQMAKEIALKDL